MTKKSLVPGLTWITAFRLHHDNVPKNVDGRAQLDVAKALQHIGATHQQQDGAVNLLVTEQGRVIGKVERKILVHLVDGPFVEHVEAGRQLQRNIAGIVLGEGATSRRIRCCQCQVVGNRLNLPTLFGTGMALPGRLHDRFVRQRR
jgi:hypothetical protein